jgi:hypothetical protein
MLLSGGWDLKLLGPCFLHYRLSFCILRDLITLIEPFMRELSPTLRYLFTIKYYQILLKGFPLSSKCLTYSIYFGLLEQLSFALISSLRLLEDLFSFTVLNMCDRLSVQMAFPFLDRSGVPWLVKSFLSLCISITDAW